MTTGWWNRFGGPPSTLGLSACSAIVVPVVYLDELFLELTALLLLGGSVILDQCPGRRSTFNVMLFCDNRGCFRGGHCPHDEVPDRVNAALREWLQGLSRCSHGYPNRSLSDQQHLAFAAMTLTHQAAPIPIGNCSSSSGDRLRIIPERRPRQCLALRRSGGAVFRRGALCRPGQEHSGRDPCVVSDLRQSRRIGSQSMV